jgi:hypothetical protein
LVQLEYIKVGCPAFDIAFDGDVDHSQIPSLLVFVVKDSNPKSTAFRIFSRHPPLMPYGFGNRIALNL